MTKVNVTTEQFTERIDDVKGKLDSLNLMFDSLEIYDKKAEEILSHKESKIIQNLMEPILKEYKFNLQGEKFYELDINEIDISKIFAQNFTSYVKNQVS